MDQMANYNKYYFDLYYKKYHENDTSLVCQNNTLYYLGDTTNISGMINVQQNEKVYLDRFSLATLNNDQWQMKPFQLFFYIKKNVELLLVDIKNSLMSIYNTASKNNLEETDKLSLYYTIDFYNALKSIETHLSGKLFDAYKYLKDMFTRIRTMTDNNITAGFRLIYNKIFGEIKNDYNNDSGGNENANVRTRYSGPKPIAPPPTPLYSENTTDNNQMFNNVAFISVVALILLILVIVVGTMTYIFS